MKKSISFLLLLCILFGSLTACGDDSDSKKTQTTPDDTTSAVETEASPKDQYGRDIVESSIPQGTYFDDTELTLLHRDMHGTIDFTYEFVAEEEISDLVNDNVYKRNRETEESIGVKLNFYACSEGDFSGLLQRSIHAQDGAYDMAAFYSYYGVSWALEGYYCNLLATEYIDFDKPWWNSDFVNELTLNNQLYFAVGDIALSTIDRMYAIFFNKALAAEYFSDTDLYDVVNEGKWTADMFTTLIKDSYHELNGNSEADEDDFYGWIAPAASIPIDGIQIGFGINITETDSDGIPSYVYGNERSAAGYSKLYEMFTNNRDIYPGKYTLDSINLAISKFENSTSIFLIDLLCTTTQLRNMKDDYGVLPLFKLDENQSEYCTTSDDVSSFVAIVSSCRTPDAASAALEKMSELSYQYVTPAYFEVALKTKYASGEDDPAMYDLIIASRKYNFGYVMSSAINNPTHVWRTLLDGRKDTFVSTIEKSAKSNGKALDKLIEKFDKLVEAAN